MANALPLSQLCTTVLNILAPTAAAPKFNVGCVIGTSPVIPTSGANARLQSFPSAAAMIQAGFGLQSPEVLAAQSYFAFTPSPTLLYVGRQDVTSLATITTGSAGSGYVVGDLISLIQQGASGGVAKITSVNGTGGVTGVVISAQGTGFAVGTSLATTGGKGTGATINVTAVGETPLQAVTACCNASRAFWGLFVTSALDSDTLAINAYVEGLSGGRFNFWQSGDPNIPGGITPNIGATTQGLSQRNNAGFYATIQGGAAPLNAYLAAEVMGAVCGLNSGLAGSYFTVAGTTLSNSIPEALSTIQASQIAQYNLNIYGNYGDRYKFIEPGITPSGRYIDEVLFESMLASDLQTALIGVIQSNRSVPMTDPGQQLFLRAAASIGDKYVGIGYLAPGVYTGTALLSLTSGQSLPTGYFVQSPSYLTQTAANRAARIAPPVYFNGLQAQSGQSITIGINLQE